METAFQKHVTAAVVTINGSSWKREACAPVTGMKFRHTLAIRNAEGFHIGYSPSIDVCRMTSTAKCACGRWVFGGVWVPS